MMDRNRRAFVLKIGTAMYGPLYDLSDGRIARDILKRAVRAGLASEDDVSLVVLDSMEEFDRVIREAEES